MNVSPAATAQQLRVDLRSFDTETRKMNMISNDNQMIEGRERTLVRQMNASGSVLQQRTMICALLIVYGFPVKDLIEIVNGRHGEAETRRNEVV